MFSGSGSGSGSSCTPSGSDCSCPIYQEWCYVGTQHVRDQKQDDRNTNTDISRRVYGAFRTLPLMYIEAPRPRRTFIGDSEYYPVWSLYVDDADGSSAGPTTSTGVVCDATAVENVRCVGLFGYFDYVSYRCESIDPRGASSQILQHPYLEQYGYVGRIVNHSWKLIDHEQHTCKQHRTKQVTGFTFQIHWTPLKQQPQQQKEGKQLEEQKLKQQQQQQQQPQQQERAQPFSSSLKTHDSLHSPTHDSNNDGCIITYHFQVTGTDTAILSVCGVDWSLTNGPFPEFKSRRQIRPPLPVPVPTFDPA